MAKTKWTPEERHFFESVGRAIFMNPFDAAREHLLGGVSPGHDGEAFQLDPRLYAFVAEVEMRIAKLEAAGFGTIDHFDAAERRFMEPMFLYLVYHRFVKDLDRLVHRQLEMGDTPAPVPFAPDLLAALGARGFSEERSRHYFAMFYKLRRAFFFILTSLVGDSRSMRTLRSSLWNGLFTHDMHTYDLYLWNRMEGLLDTPPRRDRHGEGVGRLGDRALGADSVRREHGPLRVELLEDRTTRSTSRSFPRGSSNPSSSATARARLPVRSPITRASSTCAASTARSSSTRSGR
jgi:hypothetical protein